MRYKWRRVGSVIVFLVPFMWLTATMGPQNSERVGAVNPGGAPAPGSGTTQTTGFVRVLDGSHAEAQINGNRTVFRLTGVTTPQGNTACGREATKLFESLARGGLMLEEDTRLAFDDLNYRVYHARTKDGRSVSQELVRAGVASVETAIGEGRFHYMSDAAAARGASRGCLNSGNAASLAPSRAPRPVAPRSRAVAPRTAFPTGFAQETLGTGYDTPVAIAFVPDGRVFVAEKPGAVKVIKNGATLSAPLLAIYDRVNDYSDRGLLSIAVDPDFATNHYLYALFTYENDASDYNGKKTSRLARYTVSGDTADPATETILLGSKVGSGCDGYYASDPNADCLGSENPSHSIGTVRFAADKTLFVSVGDGSSFDLVDNDALRAQDTRKLVGKLLHINRNGKGMDTNPFWDGNANHGQSKVWAYGLRNPFRFALKPGSDVPFLGDVGWVTWEEVNVGSPGANYGWPCYEGNYQQSGYASKSVCQTLYGQGTGAVRFGINTWNHNQWPENPTSASIGGAFYSGTLYPAQYRGAYFLADYAQGTINWLTVNADNTLANAPTTFSTNADGPVDIEMGPDGWLYYVAINSGEVRRIVYNTLTATATCTPSGGALPLAVQCVNSVTTDPLGGTLTHTWNFEDGTPDATGATVSHTYTHKGDYTVRLTVTSSAGGKAATAETYVFAGSLPPQVTITSPVVSRTYKVGDAITFSGTATDAKDGTLSGDRLAWQVILHHCVPAAGGGSGCHPHYLTQTTGNIGSFAVPDHDGDDTYLELQLTATNSLYLETTAAVSLQPVKVPLTVTTNPPGMQFIYSGITYTAPQTFPVVPGSTRTVEATAMQGVYSFMAWSDAGAAQHAITTGNSATTLTATYVTAAPVAKAAVTPTQGNAPLTVAFSCAGSTGVGLQYRWDFGDGTNDTTANPMHTYAAAGAYTASLIVTDAMNRTATAQAMPVIVKPTIAALSPAASGTQGGTTVIITGTGFAGTPSVAVGGLAAQVKQTTPTQITIVVPAHSVGVVDVVVTVNGQAATLTGSFTYGQIAPAPTPRIGATAMPSPASDPAPRREAAGSAVPSPLPAPPLR